MDELYAEAGVKVKPSFKCIFLKVFIIVVTVFSVLLALTTRSPIFAPLAAGLIILAVFMFPRLSNIEYEYIFCDGQFDFDRITGGAKRKTMFKIDMDNVEVIASPERRADFDNPSIRNIKNYSDSLRDAYMLIGATETSQVKIYFKPSQKMIECMYNKAPSKVKK